MIADNITVNTGIPAATSHFGSIGSNAVAFDNIYVWNGFKNGGGTWGSLSDERTKIQEEITPYTEGLEKLKLLQPIVFRYNGLYGTEDNGGQYVGFVAQELDRIAPEMVGTMMEQRHPGSDDPYEELLTVETTRMDYIMLNAIKELAARVEHLEAQLAGR